MPPSVTKPPAREPSRFVSVVSRYLPQGAAKRLNPALDILHNSALEAQRAHLPQMAAALAFKTIFSLIPAIVLGMVLLQVFLLRGETPEKTRQNVAQIVRQVLDYAGVSQISVQPSDEPMGPFLPGMEPPPAPQTAPQAAPQTSTPAAPVQSTSGAEPKVEQPSAPSASAGLEVPTTGSEKLDEWIVQLVMRVSQINFGAIGVIGLVGLIYAAISLIVEIEQAFNQIYRVPTGRSWVRRVTQYWTLLTLGSVGVVATVGFGIQATGWIAARASDLTGISAGNNRLGQFVAAYGLNILISTALFLLMYTVVPNAKVRVWPALAGAVIAAVLWEAGKWGLTLYLRYSTGYAALYGSIALLLLFFVWIHVSWCIVLFGLSISYHLQHGRWQTEPAPREQPPAGIIEPAAILSLMARLAKDFDQGRSATSPELAKSLSIHEPLVSAMLAKLVLAGLVNRLATAENADDEPRYTLSRPADRINAADVLALGHELAGAGQGSSAISDSLRAAYLGHVRSKSLADIAGMQPAGEPTLPIAAPPRAENRPEPRPA